MKWSDPLPEGNPAPLWHQIAERLKAAIKDSEFGPGDALPSETQLNQAFGVSRTTSRASLDRLEQEGLIRRRSGVGSIVVVPRVDQPANEMSGFAEDMRRRGLRPSYDTRFAGRVKAPLEVTEALEIPAGSLVFQSRRLLKADESPIGFAVSWLSPLLFRDARFPTRTELSKGSLYDWISRQCGVKITGAREFIEAAIVQKEMALELQTPAGSAVLVAKRISRGANNRPVEYAILHFRADRYRFHLEVAR